MHFVVIMAFAFVLSDNLPPAQFRWWDGTPVMGTVAWAMGQVLGIAVVAWFMRRVAVARFDGSPAGHDRALSALSRGHVVLLATIVSTLTATMLFSPWAMIVREKWGLDRFPLVGDLLLLVPFFAALIAIWINQYPIEARLRWESVAPPDSPIAPPLHPSGDAASDEDRQVHGHRDAEGSLSAYLVDKFRHQVLIIAAPMIVIVFAKHFTDLWRPNITRRTGLPWLSDSILATISLCVLVCAPVMLRYVWSTEPLACGPLRDRFVRTCRRIGLRYREILLWRTHGMAVNAAVMGFIPPLRYILVSDALLENMDEREIEAVFGHEAGHVHHWHLPFFGAFAATSMYVSGGLVLLLDASNLVRDYGMLQFIGLAVLLVIWLFGFGWLSRRFERQADLFGVRCVTPDIETCTETCTVHGSAGRPHGLCLRAANLFGMTLIKIANLNGIPRSAPSWRHGSIESRCRLIERLAADPAALRRFDRSLLAIKVVLGIIFLIGSILGGVIYYPSVARALGWQ